LLGTNEELSRDLTATKLANAGKAGADLLCVVCPLCQIQFDRVRSMILSQRGPADYPPSILFTQLLGLSLGIDEKRLGLEKNMAPISGVEHLNLFGSPKAVGTRSGPTR
jgi:heterodisulfide reductase subunit B